MTATATQDEDLIILNDDTSSNDIFNFDTTPVMEASPVTDVIDFGNDDLVILDTPTSQVENVSVEPEITLVQEETTSALSDFDFGFSFDTPVTQESAVVVEEVTPVVEDVTSDFSFDFHTDASQEVVETPVVEDVVVDVVETPVLEEISMMETIEEVSPVTFETSNVVEMTQEVVETPVVLNEGFDVNAILDTTIAQLQARKDVIKDTKSQKSSQVSDLMSQIEALQAQVESLNTEISELEFENKKIDKNISSIESMKLDTSDVADIPERQRKHAPEKIKAKK
jgi:regulator of replication initiation timing